MRETIEATLSEVMRATREGIRINTFMLDASHALQAFIEQITAINKGRAFLQVQKILVNICWLTSSNISGNFHGTEAELQKPGNICFFYESLA